MLAGLIEEQMAGSKGLLAVFQQHSEEEGDRLRWPCDANTNNVEEEEAQRLEEASYSETLITVQEDTSASLSRQKG